MVGVEWDVAAYLFDRAVSVFAAHVQAAIDKAQEGKSGPAAQAAAENALAPWIGAEQKFRDPSPGHF
jgi:hypothetical protein